MYNKEEVLQKVDILYNMWKKGSLGGEVMPEDTNPHLDLSLCKTFTELYDGDIRELFDSLDNDVYKIKNFIQKENKKKFPYLSGIKICNYLMKKYMRILWQKTPKNGMKNLQI